MVTIPISNGKKKKYKLMNYCVAFINDNKQKEPY